MVYIIYLPDSERTDSQPSNLQSIVHTHDLERSACDPQLATDMTVNTSYFWGSLNRKLTI